MDEPELETHLRAGIAVYNAGHYHAAHDAWEDCWLDLEEGSDDGYLLQGLIQFTAAVYHAHRGNWAGATGLARSACEYLSNLPTAYREVNIGDVRAWLARLERDPELIERERPLKLQHEEGTLDLDDLTFPAVGIVARVFAEEYGYNESTIYSAVEYAAQDLAAKQPTSPFVSLLLDFVQSEADRDIAVQRLSQHVERRDHHESDVEGLFEE